MAEKDDYLIDILVDLSFVTADKVAELRPEAQASGVAHSFRRAIAFASGLGIRVGQGHRGKHLAAHVATLS